MPVEIFVEAHELALSAHVVEDLVEPLLVLRLRDLVEIAVADSHE
jgi:hypothetical protein